MACILFLTQVLPYPLYGGAKIRAYYVLRHLAERHDVTLVSFIRESDQPEAISHLQQYCQTIVTVPMQRSLIKNGQAFLKSVIYSLPIVILRDHLTEMEERIKQLVKKTTFEVIHADQTSMAYYGMFARDLHITTQKPLLVLDQHNALYLVVQRQARFEGNLVLQALWRREAHLLSGYEADLLEQYDHILTVTREDKAALLRLPSEDQARAYDQKITVVPICVDPNNQPMIHLRADAPKIIHLGTMFWPPNVEGVLWFANKVFPMVLEKIPEAHFTIVGKDPPAKVKALQNANSLPTGPIEVTDFIADPIRLLADSLIFVVPLLAGGGMRVKILDAWQWGLPIVSTTIGAEGIAIDPGENILIADDPETFADAVVKLLNEPVLREKLIINGRRTVEQNYDWRSQYWMVDNIYQPSNLESRN